MSSQFLGEIAEIVDCEHKTAPVASGKPYAYSVGTSALSDNEINFDKCKPVSAQTYREWSKRAELRKGDIILAREAPVGGVGLVEEGAKVCLGQRTVLVRPNPEFVDQVFLNYLLQTPDVQRWMTQMSNGSTVKHLNVGDIKRLPLPPLPSLEKQKMSSMFLRELDEKINVNNKLSKLLEELARTLFTSWFIDFDPVKAKMSGERLAWVDENTSELFPDSLVDSAAGLVPEGWEPATLGDCLDMRKATVKAGLQTESLPYVPVDHIGAKDLFLKNYLLGFEAKTSLVGFQKNDILFGAMRPYFHKVALAPFDGTTRTTTFVLRPKNPKYLAFGLLSVFQDKAVAYATKHSQGTTIPYLVWKGSFEDFPIVLPPDSLADAFNELVLPMFEFGYSLVAQNVTLANLRNSLIPRLISSEAQTPEEMLAS